jgi:hypothetical protein
VSGDPGAAALDRVGDRGFVVGQSRGGRVKSHGDSVVLPVGGTRGVMVDCTTARNQPSRVPAMNDDWRLRITLENDDTAHALTARLKEHTTSDDRSRSIHDRIVVSSDGPEVFCYAGTQEQAEATRRAVEQLAQDARWAPPQFELMHWHPTAERWEDAELPLPATDAERAEELRQRIAQERTDTERQGYPDFEVRVQCPSRAEAAQLAERLHNEGIPTVHRWSAVLVGATDEASAAQLAERLRAEAPAGSQVTVEGNLRAIWEDRPWVPFSVLGGMGG